MGAIGRVEGEGGASVSIINFGSRYRRAPSKSSQEDAHQGIARERPGYPSTYAAEYIPTPLVHII